MLSDYTSSSDTHLKKIMSRRKDKKGENPELSDPKKQLGIAYECVKCGSIVSSEELDLRGGGIKCTYCGYRVLKKIRPPIVKRIKTK